MQKRQNSLYPYLVLSDKTLIATKLKNRVFTEFQNFRGFVGSPWEIDLPESCGSITDNAVFSGLQKPEPTVSAPLWLLKPPDSGVSFHF